MPPNPWRISLCRIMSEEYFSSNHSIHILSTLDSSLNQIKNVMMHVGPLIPGPIGQMQMRANWSQNTMDTNEVSNGTSKTSSWFIIDSIPWIMNHESALVVVASNLGIEFPFLEHFFFLDFSRMKHLRVYRMKNNINKMCELWVNGSEHAVLGLCYFYRFSKLLFAKMI